MSDASDSSRLPVVAAAVVVVLLLVVGGVVWFLGGDDPDEVDAETALEQAAAAVGTETDATETDATETETDATGGDADGEQDATDGEDEGASAAPTVAGEWTVDTGAVPYSFDDGAGTFVGFRIDEELTNIGATTAVGRTPAVEGRLVLDGTTVTEATFAGDPAELTTDRGRRDNAARRAIGDEDLRFDLTEPIELDGDPAPGEPVTATATGDLTINGVTRSYSIPLDARLAESGLLLITSSFEVALTDHDVETPSGGPVLSIEDVATVEVQLFLSS